MRVCRVEDTGGPRCAFEPGDVIATGTPSGVGNATQTCRRAGDVVDASIDGIGALRTRVVKEPAR